jgi:hypothetical protein
LKSVEDVSNSGDLSVVDESNILLKLYCLFFWGGGIGIFFAACVAERRG